MIELNKIYNEDCLEGMKQLTLYIIEYTENSTSGYTTRLSKNAYQTPGAAEREIIESYELLDGNQPYLKRQYQNGLGWAKIRQVEVVGE